MKQDRQHQKSKITLVAVGGNLRSSVGNPLETVAFALGEIGARWASVKVSAFYQTPAFPEGAGPDFVNAACAFSTTDTAETVLQALHGIEAALGRARSKRWGQRTIDLDLIAQGDAILPDLVTYDRWRNLPMQDQGTSAPDRLILPHPRVQDRSFVLVPLADLAPDWVHPRLGQTTLEMLNNRPQSERETVVRLET